MSGNNLKKKYTKKLANVKIKEIHIQKTFSKILNLILILNKNFITKTIVKYISKLNNFLCKFILNKIKQLYKRFLRLIKLLKIKMVYLTLSGF